MTEYVVLVVNRRDTYDRDWVQCESLEFAKLLASKYIKDTEYSAYIYEVGKSI